MGPWEIWMQIFKKFRSILFYWMVSLRFSDDDTPRWMPQDLTEDK